MAITPRKSADGKRTSYLVRIESTDPVTGKRKRITVGSFRTRKEAERAERDALVKRDQGMLLDPAKTTIGELLDAWLASKRSSLSSQSFVDYGITIRQHLKPALGNLLVQKLTAQRLQLQIGAWEEQGLSAHVIRGCLMRLSQALDQAVDHNLVHRNVCDRIKLPRLGQAKTDVWSIEEVRTFLESAERDALHPLWHLLVLEGMRKGEALGLRWQDINWERGTAHLAQTVISDKSQGGKTVIQRRTKTAASARTVRLTEPTLQALDATRALLSARRAASESWQDNDLIVCTGHGTPVSPRNVTRNFDHLTSAAGLRRIRVHDLRHTAATLLLRAGVPSKVVSERLGHTKTSTTLDLYSHVLPDMQDAAAAAIDRLMAKVRET